MKHKFLFLSLFVVCSTQAMDPAHYDRSSDDSARMSTADPADVDRRIADTIGGAGSVADLQTLCEQRLGMASPVMPRRGGGKRKPKVDPLKAAREAAQRNLDRAKANLSWTGNTGRRNQVAVGVGALLLGVSKGVYDFLQFWDDDADKTAAGFGLATDGALALGGVYGIKLAFENGGAQTEYDKAVTMQLFVESMAQGRSDTAASSSSSSVMEVVGFADDSKGDSSSADGSSESASSASSSDHSGGSSANTSRDVSSGSFLSEDGD